MENYISFEDHERRKRARSITITTWVFGPDPDPTYDPLYGWKLDQFAMHFEPELLRAYKRAVIEETRLRIAGVRVVPDIDSISNEVELHERIIARLLEKGIEVKGRRPGLYDAEPIPPPLIEIFYPVIETSELVEKGGTEFGIRYEQVRILVSAPKKSSRGTKPTYDFLGLSRKLEKEGPIFPSKQKLVDYCRENVRPVPGDRGKKAREDGPDDATARAAIEKYGWMKFVQTG
jgi:hypothetical protein